MKEILPSGQVKAAPQSTDDTIGLDLGDRWSRYCVLDRNGAVVVEDDRVRTNVAALVMASSQFWITV